MSFYS